MHTSWHSEDGAWLTRLRGRQVFGEPTPGAGDTAEVGRVGAGR